jgi:hypothetical protein
VLLSLSAGTGLTSDQQRGGDCQQRRNQPLFGLSLYLGDGRQLVVGISLAHAGDASP